MNDTFMNTYSTTHSHKVTNHTQFYQPGEREATGTVKLIPSLLKKEDGKREQKK